MGERGLTEEKKGKDRDEVWIGDKNYYGQILNERGGKVYKNNKNKWLRGKMAEIGNY